MAVASLVLLTFGRSGVGSVREKSRLRTLENEQKKIKSVNFLADYPLSSQHSQAEHNTISQARHKCVPLPLLRSRPSRASTSTSNARKADPCLLHALERPQPEKDLGGAHRRVLT